MLELDKALFKLEIIFPGYNTLSRFWAKSMEKNQSPWFKLKDEDPGHEFILLTEIGIIGLEGKWRFLEERTN